MKRYKVEITSPAFNDLRESYIWGAEKWGAVKARAWIRAAKKAAYSLVQFPERHSLVPQQEQTELGHDVRQMVFQRYRILFTIKDDMVYVLHVRGAFKEDVSEQDEE
jgi:plasmid stabilization system protein ParE